MDGLEGRVNPWEVLLSSRHVMRTAQTKAEVVEETKGPI